jgi:hypothetical protein
MTQNDKDIILKSMKKTYFFGFLFLNSVMFGQSYIVNGYLEWWQFVLVPIMVFIIMMSLYFGFKSRLPEVEEENAKSRSS